MNTPNKPQMPKIEGLSGWMRAFPVVYKFGSSDTAQLILATIGGIVVIRALSQLVNWILSVGQSPRLAVYRHAGNDSWALVTGASDGIGKGFSEELLRRGYNVLLHGRNQQKLDRVRKELLEKWPKRKADIVVADAAEYDNAYEIVVKKAKSLPGKLTILVNNVGGQITLPRYLPLSEVKHEDLDQTMNVNARFPTHLTASLIPLLQEHSPSLIINCGSTGGVMGTPYITTYCASKAYIHTFSKSLKYEMVAEGTPNVEVMGFVIGNTQTAGNPHDMPFFTLEGRDCASSCLDRVGKSGGPVVWSHWRHAFQYNAMSFLPQSFIDRQVAKEMKKRVDAEKEQLGSAKKDL